MNYHEILPHPKRTQGLRGRLRRQCQCLAVALLTLLGTLLGTARAALIVSSLDNYFFPNVFLDGPPIAGSSSFQTGTQAWTLSSVTVQLTWGVVFSNVSPAVNIRLLADAGGEPGTVLADLGWLDVTNYGQDFVNYTFPAPSAVQLNPSTTYWVTVGVGTNGTATVAMVNASGFTYIGAPGASMTVDFYLAYSPTYQWIAEPNMGLMFEVDGTPIAAPVSLQMTPVGNQVVLSWPSSASNFVLETSSLLSSDATWRAVTNGAVTVGDNFVLTNSADAPAAFFRLHVSGVSH
ncbi:exported hypothetical protein [Verrucomicrobia bacterium]|nr:exported hypothetical protein [Verrucomicrobiota bacterium]